MFFKVPNSDPEASQSTLHNQTKNQQTQSDNVREKFFSGKEPWADPNFGGQLSALSSWGEEEKMQSDRDKDRVEDLHTDLRKITLWGHF